MTLASQAVNGADVAPRVALGILSVTLALMLIAPLARLLFALALALFDSVLGVGKSVYALDRRRRWQVAVLGVLAWTALMAGVFLGRTVR
jgi:hypothetical protein